MALQHLAGGIVEQLIIFVVLWFLLSSYSVYRIISLLAVSGKVTADDRFAVLLAMTPLSYVVAPLLTLFDLYGFFRVWSCNRRGPLVRIVEYLHNKRKEQRYEEDLPTG